MLNLIRMNLYRMVNSVSMWVLLIIPVFFCVFTMTLLKDAIENDGPDTFAEGFVEGWNAHEDEAQATADGSVDIVIGYHNNNEGPVGEGGILAYVWSDFASGILTLFTTIAAVIFISSESNSGFIKNLASQNMSRAGIFFAKMIALYIYCFIMMLIYFVVDLVGILIIYKGDVAFGMKILPEALAGIGCIYLLTVAFTTAVALLTAVTKSTAISMTISILINMGFVNFLYVLIQQKFNFNIAKYLTMPTLNELVPGIADEVIIRALIIGIIYTLVYNVIGMIWVTKRDVV